MSGTWILLKQGGEKRHSARQELGDNDTTCSLLGLWLLSVTYLLIPGQTAVGSALQALICLAEPWEVTERICSCFSRDSVKGGRMASQISENVSRDCMCQCGWVSQDYSLRTTSGCRLRWAVYWPTRLVEEPWDPEGHYHRSTGTGSTVSYPET